MNAGIRQSLVLGALLAFCACGSKGNPNQPGQGGGGTGGGGTGGGGTGGTPTLTSVAVSGGNSVTVGSTVQFSATANFSNSTTQNVSSTATWASSNTAFATVSSTGLATGVAAGSADIRATFQGMTGSMSLQVNAPVQVPPVAQFSVSGPDACRIIVGSSGNLDCTFNGSASTGGTGGAVSQWIWRYDVGTNSAGPITENDPMHTPTPGCGFFVNKPTQSGTGFVQMIVKLQVRNAAGTISQELRNSNVRLFPQKQCGFGF